MEQASVPHGDEQSPSRDSVSIAVTRAGMPGSWSTELREIAELTVWTDEVAPDADELAEFVAGAAGLLCLNGDRIDGPLLDRCPSIRIVAVASAGYDSIDVAAAAERGVAVTHTPGVLAETTADLAFGLILAARRRIVEADRFVRRGEWTRSDLGTMVGHDVYGATLGVVGAGEIGEAVIRRGRGFGMRVLHHGRTRRTIAGSTWVELDELLRRADVVSLHVPLSTETERMIGAREIGLMKPGATLVNTARGPVLDEAALLGALRSGQLHSAGLDVQSVEPNPNTADPLLQLPNCVVTPHMGSATDAARAAMVNRAAENLLAHFAGRDLISPVPVEVVR